MDAFSTADAIIYTTFTTGADITTAQTVYESGGLLIGTELQITAGNLEVLAGNTNARLITTAIAANTSYSVAVVYDLTNDTLRLYLKTGLNEVLATADLINTVAFTQIDWCGDDGTGVGQTNNDSVSGGTGGAFSGTALTQISLYTTNDISSISTMVPAVEFFTADVDTARVGIGTENPTQTLTVNGTAQITGALHDSSGNAGTNGQVLSTTSTGTNWIDFSSSGLIDDDADTQIQVEEGGPGTDDDTIRFDTAGTERMVIDNSGNVGIATATPSAPLDIAVTAGKALEFDNGQNIITVHDGSGNFNFKSGVDENNTINAAAGGSHLRLDEGGSIELLIDENTAVGGTFSPTLSLLMEQDRIQFTGGDAVAIGGSRSGLTVQTPDNTLDAGLSFQNSGGAYTGSIYRTPGVINPSATEIAFSTGLSTNVNSLAERLRITNLGNVGIGTDAPTASLHVSGTLRVGTIIGAASTDNLLKVDNLGNLRRAGVDYRDIAIQATALSENISTGRAESYFVVGSEHHGKTIREIMYSMFSINGIFIDNDVRVTIRKRINNSSTVVVIANNVSPSAPGASTGGYVRQTTGITNGALSRGDIIFIDITVNGSPGHQGLSITLSTN